MKDNSEQLKMQAFDWKLKEQNEFAFMGFAIVKWMMIVFSVVLMFIPYDEEMLGIMLGMGLMGVGYGISPFFGDGDQKNNTRVSVYWLLQYTPISRKAIFTSRLRILGKEFTRYLILCLTAQVIGSVASGCFSWISIVYPLAVAGVVGIFGLTTLFLNAYSVVK